MAQLVAKDFMGQPEKEIIGLPLGIVDGRLVQDPLIGNNISLFVALSRDPFVSLLLQV